MKGVVVGQGSCRFRGKGEKRVQLKLAQFSHSPVIRVPGIYIIKPRKFLSPPLPSLPAQNRADTHSTPFVRARISTDGRAFVATLVGG